jgi:hypothetical protein
MTISRMTGTTAILLAVGSAYLVTRAILNRRSDEGEWGDDLVDRVNDARARARQNPAVPSEGTIGSLAEVAQVEAVP